MDNEPQAFLASETDLPGNYSLEGLVSPLEGTQRSKMASLPRQNSIYTLTLHEFQNTMVEAGKNFGSMNMDELLKNIWTVEESQAMAATMVGNQGAFTGLISSQPSLQRQPSLTLPRTLSRKTVDEVWRGIQQGSGGSDDTDDSPADPQDRQVTLGEMTLEDFLVKAGVFRETLEPNPQSFVPYGGGGMSTNPSTTGGVKNSFAKKEGGGFDIESANAEVNPTFSLCSANALANQSELDIGFKLNNNPRQAEWMNGCSYQNPRDAVVNHAGVAPYLNGTNKMRENGMAIEEMGIGSALGSLEPTLGIGLVHGYGGANQGIQQLGAGLGGVRRVAGLDLVGPVSPASPISDGLGQSGMTNYNYALVGNYAMDVGLRGRKRRAEGPVEKMIERRQKRMIKNRESAARSRARKHAYTVELEAEVSQLKEENSRLRRLQEQASKCSWAQMFNKMVPMARQLTSQRRLRRTRTVSW